jgi:hypothetical protein
LPPIVYSQCCGKHGRSNFCDEQDYLRGYVLWRIFRFEELWANYISDGKCAGDQRVSCNAEFCELHKRARICSNES